MFRSRSYPASPSHVSPIPNHKRGSGFLVSNTHAESDLDGSRKGKRRRRDNFPPVETDTHSVFSTCENRMQPDPQLSFATTSAQFNLFSRSSSGGKGRRNPPSDFKVSQERQHGCLPDLARLRSSAFWELHQSISENGEGLVRRMRDYENSRSKHPAHQKAKEASKHPAHQKAKEASKRERKKLHFRKRKVFVDASDASDEDDVLISSGESANHILRGTFLRKVKDPIAVMDVDSDWPSVPHSHSHTTRPRGQYPGQDTHYTSNANLAIEEPSIPIMTSVTDDMIQPPPIGALHSPTPSLSLSTEGSPCSSFVSLPGSSSVISDEFYYPSSCSGQSSASDKALAALNLAMANGAGSINDYSLVNSLEDIIVVDNYDHGELWN